MTAPAPATSVTRTETLPRQASILCNDARFRRWVGQRIFGQPVEVTPLAAAEFVRRWCGIDSRSALATDPHAAVKFKTLRTEYDAARGRIGRPP